jgi:hypothetical protein
MADDESSGDDSRNLATLWVSVVPTVKKVAPVMEKAGEEAREKFRDKFSPVGDDIAEVFKKSGAKSGDKFSDELETKTKSRSKQIGSTAGEEFGDSFGAPAGKRVSERINEALDKLGQSGTSAESGQTLGSKLGSAAGKVMTQKISDELADQLGGGKSNADNLGKIFGGQFVDGAGGIIQDKLSGVFKSTLPAELGPVADTLGSTIGGKIAEGIARILTDNPLILGALASAAIAGKKLADASLNVPFIHNRFYNDDGSPTNSFERWADRNVPGMRWLVPGDFNDDGTPKTPKSAAPPPPNFYRDWYPQTTNIGEAGGIPRSSESGFGPPVGAVGGHGSPMPSGLGVGGAGQFPAFPPVPEAPSTEHNPGGVPGSGNKSPFAHMPAFKPAPQSAPDDNGSSSDGTGGLPRVSVGGVSDRRGVATAGSRIANLYALANALQGTPYSQALRNDCSGMVSQLAAVAAGLPDPSPGERFTTVNEGESLARMGFQPGIGPPGSLRVGWYDHGGGNAGHTAMTLPGGEHAESGGSHGNFLVGPGAAGADNPEFDHHAWLPMSGRAPGISGGGLRLGAPDGTQHNPFFVVSAGPAGTGGGSGGAKGGTSGQGQQIGQDMFNGALGELGLDGSVFQGFDGSSLQSSSSSIGSVISGLTQLMPGMNGSSMSRSAIPTGPGGAQNVRTGETTNNYFGDVAPFNITQHGVNGNGVPEFEQHKNAMAAGRGPALTANLPGK